MSPDAPQGGTHHATSTPDGQETTPGQTCPAERRTAPERNAMSKPLELTIYPPLPPLVRAAVEHNVENSFEPYFGLSPEVHVPGLLAVQAKRLTDAELAAEYWAPAFIHFPDPTVWDRDYAGTSAEMSRRSDTFHRLATSPHYFEVDAA